MGTPESTALLVEELGSADSSARRSALLIGMEEGLRGRRQVGDASRLAESLRGAGR